MKQAKVEVNVTLEVNSMQEATLLVDALRQSLETVGTSWSSAAKQAVDDMLLLRLRPATMTSARVDR